MNLYLLVIVIYILFHFFLALTVKETFRSSCPMYTLLPEQSSTTNYDPYLEINNSSFQSYLSRLFPIKTTTNTPTVTTSNQLPSIFSTQVLSRINQSLSNVSTEPDHFRILSSCVLISSPSYYKWYLYLYRPMKNYGFQLQIETMEQEHCNVMVVGNIPQQELSSVSGMSPSPITTTYQIHETTESPILLSKREQANYLINYVNRKKDFVNKMGYHCYGDSTFTRQKSCESIYDQYGNLKLKGRGYWDKQCEKNEDCPFYKANKNYPNERGGCNDGWCEMPVNIKQTSYRLYEPSSQPYCYNCDVSDDRYRCCSQQEQKSKDAYTLMSSADYAFAGDASERQQHKNDFFQRGLSTSDV